MTLRDKHFGLAQALSLSAACLAFTSPVLAQDAEGALEPASPDASLSASAGTSDAASAGAAAPEAPAAGAAEPSTTPPVDTPPADAEKPAGEQPQKAPAAAGDGKVPLPAGWPIKQLTIVETPWTAYPSQQIRGLTYGSLWRTFHGQQWPYVPKTDPGPEPTLQIGWSGSIWNDLSYTAIDVDASRPEGDQNRWNSQTRATLRMTPTLNVNNGWFVQGNAEVVLQGDMVASNATGGVLATTDDLWIRVGKWNVFDAQVGRFQGWEIANHFGMGLDWGTLERSGAWAAGTSIQKPTDGYGLDYFWDRQNYLLGGYALHVYPTKWLRGELLGHIGAGNGNASNPYQFDVRPAAIVDLGWMKLKGGYEFGKATPQDSSKLGSDQKNGFGFAAQFVLAPYVEFGGSFARGYQDIVEAHDLPELDKSNTVQSAGGFVNVSPGIEQLLIGGGLFLKEWENFRPRTDGSVETNQQWLFFGAVQYTLWRQLYLKAVVSHASNKGDYTNGGEYVNNSISGRFRVELLF